MMPGNHDPRENPCFKLEKDKEKCKTDENHCWPSLLKPQLKEIEHDGKITPDEFEKELYELKVSNPTKLTKLMKDVLEHPTMWT